MQLNNLPVCNTLYTIFFKNNISQRPLLSFQAPLYKIYYFVHGISSLRKGDPLALQGQQQSKGGAYSPATTNACTLL